MYASSADFTSRLEVDYVTDLSSSSFAFLPRQIVVARCFQSTSTPGEVCCVPDVCFDLVPMVLANRFIYSTKDKANKIIFNGSAVEFDFSTFVSELPSTCLS